MMFGKRILSIALVLLFALSLSTTSALAQEDSPGKAGLAAPLVDWLKSLREELNTNANTPFLLPFVQSLQSSTSEAARTTRSEFSDQSAQLHELSATIRSGQNAARGGWYIEHATAVQWAEQVWERIQNLFSAKEASSASLKGTREITVF